MCTEQLINCSLNWLVHVLVSLALFKPQDGNVGKSMIQWCLLMVVYTVGSSWVVAKIYAI